MAFRRYRSSCATHGPYTRPWGKKMACPVEDPAAGHRPRLANILAHGPWPTPPAQWRLQSSPVAELKLERKVKPRGASKSPGLWPMRLRCAFDAPSKSLGLWPMRLRCAFDAPSMHLRCTFEVAGIVADAPSMRLRCAFDAPSMPLRCPFDDPSMCLRRRRGGVPFYVAIGRLGSAVEHNVLPTSSAPCNMQQACGTHQRRRTKTKMQCATCMQPRQGATRPAAHMGKAQPCMQCGARNFDAVVATFILWPLGNWKCSRGAEPKLEV